MTSDRTLKRWYNKIRKDFFYGELDIPTNVCVRWDSPWDSSPRDDCKKYDGWSLPLEGRHAFEIVIVKSKNPGASTRIATLVHEMMHVHLKCEDDHGPDFERVRVKLANRGIFKKGAIRKGLTLF